MDMIQECSIFNRALVFIINTRRDEIKAERAVARLQLCFHHLPAFSYERGTLEGFRALISFLNAKHLSGSGRRFNRGEYIH